MKDKISSQTLPAKQQKSYWCTLFFIFYFLASCLWLIKVTLLRTSCTCFWANLWVHRQEIFRWVELLIKVMCYFIFLEMFGSSYQYTFPPEHMWACQVGHSVRHYRGNRHYRYQKSSSFPKLQMRSHSHGAYIFPFLLNEIEYLSPKWYFCFLWMPACVLPPGLLCTVDLLLVFKNFACLDVS